MNCNQRVKFWIAQDDSGYASECFGVEEQNDWYDIQYYPEQIEGIIIWDKGLLLAQQTYKGKQGVKMRGKVFDITRNGIKKRIEHIHQMLENYDMSIKDFLDGTENTSIECFYDVVSLNGA
ncbi:MAG: hypothetical protein ABIC04_02440 [Nanoarchaeota archaeon]